MDFDDAPEEAAYRAEVRAWLAANAQPAEAASLARARAWQATKAAAGYAAIAQPVEWGGGGGTVMQQIIFNLEEEALGLNLGSIGVGPGLCVPLFLALGDDELKARHVRAAITGENLWCQLFSEPSAGSDLAGLRTRARRDGEDWVIDGQKIWNSSAQHADFGILMTRTDPNVPKHEGLTMFWVDMRSPGVEVRPIHQASGGREFNEVFLDGVRIPDSQRIGPVGGGWRSALVTLANERMTVIAATRRPNWEEAMALARQVPAPGGTMLDDPAFRERLADWYVGAEGIRFTRMRLLTALSRGGQPGSEASIGKILTANQLQAVTNEATELLDQFGVLVDEVDSPLGAPFAQMLLYAPGARIGGGTDEIMRNIIAERVLGLPPEIRADKGIAFRDLPVSVRK